MKKFLVLLILLLESNFLDTIPHGPWLSFREVLSPPLPFMLTSDTDFNESAFFGSVCSSHCPFLLEGCMKIFLNQVSLNQPQDFIGSTTKILVVFDQKVTFSKLQILVTTHTDFPQNIIFSPSLCIFFTLTLLNLRMTALSRGLVGRWRTYFVSAAKLNSLAQLKSLLGFCCLRCLKILFLNIR